MTNRTRTCLNTARSAAAMLALAAAQVCIAQPRIKPPPAPSGPDLSKSPLEKLGRGNPFWQHVLGDHTTTPCTHMSPEHANGDPVMAPCTHLAPEHPGGDDTGKKDPRGNAIRVPCVHIKPQHPEGHPTGATVPCVHLKPQHPQGDQGPWVPCVHPVRLVRVDQELGINFYTDNAALQSQARDAALKFKAWGINSGGAAGRLARGQADRPKTFDAYALATGGDPRMLSIFNHEPTAGFPADGTNPMWSHYNAAFHSLQIMQGETRMPSTMYHEMGHSICGHTCVISLSPGQPHSLCGVTAPAEAITEGWADFVEMALLFPQSQMNPNIDGTDVASANAGNCPKSPNCEFRVATILWDLYDIGDEPGDNISLSFGELYKVFSPTMATLSSGPILKDLDDYLERLIKNHPDKEAAIRAVRAKHLPVTREPLPTKRPLRKPGPP